MAHTSANPGVIGQFGSGNKHAVAVLLRNELSPVVFAGTLRLEFGTRPQVVSDAQATKEFSRVVVKYGGSDPITGASRSSTEDLGFVLDYGKQDWQEVALALREFVSNAIDRSIREWGDWSGVKIEVVDEAQVRAKRNFTRVFVPLSAEVLAFYNDLGKWFLHFSEPEVAGQGDPAEEEPQPGRPQGGCHLQAWRPCPGIREQRYRVPVRLQPERLADRRIPQMLAIGTCSHHCGKALANGDKHALAVLFDRLLNSDQPAWEFTFDHYSLSPSSGDSSEVFSQRSKNWSEAFAQVAGEDAVLTGKGTKDQLERKGYIPVVAPENLISAAGVYGVQTSASVLTVDEMVGRQISDATPDAQAAVDFVWSWLEETGLTNGKEKPPVKVFTSILDGGTMLNGFYRDGTVFLHEALGGTASEFGGRQALSDRLLHVALEEVAHHVTGATDNSRDFQNFLLDLAVKLRRGRVVGGGGRISTSP